MIYAIIDTNVLVSSLISSDKHSPVRRIIDSIIDKKVVPIFSNYLLEEYVTVLLRDKFGFPIQSVLSIIDMFIDNGIHIEPKSRKVSLSDEKDIPIYEIALETRPIDSYLVTGNLKHFPNETFIVSPKQIMDILDKHN